MTERITSDTHYIIIDCAPLQKRPDEILKTILHDNDTLTFEDFTLIYARFGEWKYGVFKEKETIFEANLLKIVEQLRTLYNCAIIRYAEWSPN
jgi:hypothetical protein